MVCVSVFVTHQEAARKKKYKNPVLPDTRLHARARDCSMRGGSEVRRAAGATEGGLSATSISAPFVLFGTCPLGLTCSTGAASSSWPRELGV